MGLLPKVGKEDKGVELSGFVDIDEIYYRLQFRWAGHVARLPQWRGEAHVTQILRFRSIPWLWRQARIHGHQGHTTRFRVWRWEQPIIRFFGTDWTEAAQDRNQWETSLIEAAKRRRILTK